MLQNMQSGQIQSIIDIIEAWGHQDEGIPEYQSLHDLLKQFEVQSSVTDSYFIFRFYLPLVKKEQFFLYHKYLVPIQMVNNMGWLSNSEEVTQKQQISKTFYRANGT